MKNFFKKNSVLLHNFFKSCADSTIRLFLPIIIYKQTQSLALVFIYLSLYYFLWGNMVFLLKPLFKKQSITLISLHFIPWIILTAYITFLPMNLGGIFLIATLGALAGAMYSVPINIVFSVNKKTANVARFEAASISGKMFFTVLTAYLIGSSFKDSLLLILIIGSSLYLLSSLSLLSSKKETNSLLENLPVKSNVESFKINKKYNSLHFFFGVFQNIIDIVLPLFLYYYNFTIQQVAYVIIISQVIKIAASFLARHLQKKQKSALLILFSCIFYTVVVSLIPIIKNVSFYYAASIAVPLTFPIVHVTIFSKYIDFIRQNNDLITGQSIRDFFILTPRSAVLITFFIFNSFTPIFFIGSLVSLGIIANFYNLKTSDKKLKLKNEKEVNQKEINEKEVSEKEINL